MSIVRASLSPDEVVRQGDEIYNRVLRARLEPDYNGKIVAIDVDSQDHEIGTDALHTARRLHIRRPDAEVYLLRVGSEYFRRFRNPLRRSAE